MGSGDEGWGEVKGMKCYIRKLGGGPCVLSICRMALLWKDGGPFGWGLDAF